jgi:hypothetical protein
MFLQHLSPTPVMRRLAKTIGRKQVNPSIYFQLLYFAEIAGTMLLPGVSNNTQENGMTRLDRSYILVGFAWVIAGMVFGIWLGASDHLNYANSHAHINLLGFVTSLLFGLLHATYPALRQSALATWQFLIYEIGVALLVIGKILFDGGTDTLFLQVGSLVTIAGAALMLWIFARLA